MRTMVIAEIGSTHDGDLGKAFRLIEAAKAAGADVAKAQFWSSAKRLAERRQSGPHYEAIYERYRVPQDWLAALANRAAAIGIGFMATGYLPEDLETLAPYVVHWKVASFEAADEGFIRAHFPYCAGTDRMVIVSTGLQNNATLQRLKVLRHCAATAGRPHAVDVRLLHCVSAYPAPVESLELAQMKHEEFDGFSDHAAVNWTASGAVAVAMGAKILEVHLRLDDTDPQNPDAPHALTPVALERYIRHVRAAEKAVGTGVWRKNENAAEEAMRRYRVQPQSTEDS